MITALAAEAVTNPNEGPVAGDREDMDLRLAMTFRSSRILAAWTQILNNLLSNAIKYAPGGGDIEHIEVGRDPRGEPGALGEPSPCRSPGRSPGGRERGGEGSLFRAKLPRILNGTQHDGSELLREAPASGTPEIKSAY